MQLLAIWKDPCTLSEWRVSAGHQRMGHLGAALPPCAVELAPLQWDSDHVLPQAREQDTLAVQDLQAPDGVPLPLGEELDLLQQTAA